MHKARKSRSLEDEPHRGTKCSRDAGHVRHRSQSSIPKPPCEAPLFRNDTVDRLFSKIPYPTTAGNLFYNVHTGEECWRYGKPSEAHKSSGNFSHIFQCQEERGCKHSSRDQLNSVSPGGMSDVREGSEREFEDCQHCSGTPVSTNISRLSNFEAKNFSFSSQSTVREYGSDLTDLMEDWGEQSDLLAQSVDSDACSVVSVEVHKHQGDGPRLIGLPPTFLKDCMAENETGKEWHSDIARVSSALEVHSNEAWEKHNPSRTQSPFSMMSSSPHAVYKLGRLRRRPQMPVSESSDDDSGDDETRASSAMSLSSERSKKHHSSRAVSSLLKRQTADMSLSEKDEDLEDFSICAMKFSSRGSFTSQLTFDSFDKLHHHAAERTISEKAYKGHAEEEPFRHRMAHWLGVTANVSLKALMMLSGAALVHLLADNNKTQTNKPHSTEVNDEFDVDAQEFSFSCTLVPSGQMTHSYPVSLMDSISDIGDP